MSPSVGEFDKVRENGPHSENRCDEIKVPENCKNLVPPLINSEIWNYLYVNVQQRDKTIQEAKKNYGFSDCTYD